MLGEFFLRLFLFCCGNADGEHVQQRKSFPR